MVAEEIMAAEEVTVVVGVVIGTVVEVSVAEDGAGTVEEVGMEVITVVDGVGDQL
jgi:hypothetical protein